MTITFNELRDIKHSLPTGSVARIASELNVSQQTVRNYFGAMKFNDGAITGKHIQPGPNGGIVNLPDNQILEVAQRLITEASMASPVHN